MRIRLHRLRLLKRVMQQPRLRVEQEFHLIARLATDHVRGPRHQLAQPDDPVPRLSRGGGGSAGDPLLFKNDASPGHHKETAGVVSLVEKHLSRTKRELFPLGLEQLQVALDEGVGGVILERALTTTKI